MGEISDKRTVQKDLLQDAKDALADGDSAKAIAIITDYKGPMLLNGYDKSDWDKFNAIQK